MERLNEHFVLERAPTGILSLDLEGRIRFANPRAAHLMGFELADELLGQPIRSYIQFFALGSSGEEWCVREDGSRFPIEYESAPLEEDGQIVGSVVTFRDVSERRAAARVKDNLIAVVSHELRTPLTSIRSALGLLASGHLGQVNDKGQRMLDIGVNNADRLIRLINDLLDLERIDSGEISAAGAEGLSCDVGELMVDAVETLRSAAQDASVTIEMAPIHATVPGDPDRLLQVLINLLANAIKFSPLTGGTVWLDATLADGEVLLRVRDEGRGIPVEKLESIFEPFVQVDRTDAREKGGAGLGLAICRAIVQQHGGHIWAESALGAGTTLCVALPCDESASLELIEQEAA